MFWAAAKFVLDLLTGAVSRQWAVHKDNEANDAKNKDMAASSADAQRELWDKWTRH